MTTIIEASHYQQARDALLAEGLVAHMYVQGLKDIPTSEIAHEDGSPRFHLMQMANAEYERRGGKVTNLHIGAVAEVLLTYRRSDEEAAASLAKWRAENPEAAAELDEMRSGK